MKMSNLILILTMAAGFGCVQGESVVQNPNGLKVTANSTNSCTDVAIDVGDKGLAATNARGFYSDIATVPGTNKYATAYTDAGTNTIKITYYNGSTFSHEVVAGDHLASYLRVAFLSTGVPMVFWTNGGTDVKMAARSAAFGTTGTWNLGVIDTFTAGTTRAIEVAVSPNDQVGVIYIPGNTATTAAPRFIGCSTNCATPASYTNMGAVTVNVDIVGAPTAALVGQVQLGMQWCQATAGVYVPAVSYSGTSAQARYSVCNQANLSSCFVKANWTNSTVNVTGNVASSLYIDPTVVNDTPKIATITAGIRTYEGTTGGCAAPAGWTAGAAILTSSASDGTSWLKLVKSKSTPAVVGNERYHIVANTSNTGVKYFNTSSNAFNTLASWNASGTIQTTTVTAGSSGGVAVAATSRELIATHHTAVAPLNLVAAIVRNVNVQSNTGVIDLIYPNSNGNMQLIGASANVSTATKLIAVDSTSDGRPGTVYVDNSAGTQATARLKYAFRDSLVKYTAWKMVNVPFVGTGPMYPALKFDNQNRPWISYYDQNATAANSRHYLMMNTNSDGTGVWKVYQFPFAGTAIAVGLNSTNDTALGMYFTASGGTHPVMAVLENYAAKSIRAARFNPDLEQWYTPTTIKVPTTGSANLVMDNDKTNIVLSWTDMAAATPFAGVEYAQSFNGIGWTAVKRVISDSTTVQKIGQGNAIKINPYNGYPSISYYDRFNNQVYFSTCSGNPSDCSTLNWTSTVIDSAAGVNGATTYVGAGPASTRDQMLTTALTYTSDGTATILYATGNGATIGGTTTGYLKRVDVTLAGVQSASVFKSASAVASGSITGVNIAFPGHNVEAVRTTTGELASVFVGAGNDLSSRACGIE